MHLSARALMLLPGVVAITSAVAETPLVNPRVVKVFIRKKKIENPSPNRPKAPGLDRFLTVNCTGDILTFEFPEDAETAIVSLGTGDFNVFSAVIDRNNNTVELPPLSGDFLLTVVFDNGDEYEGEISF